MTASTDRRRFLGRLAAVVGLGLPMAAQPAWAGWSRRRGYGRFGGLGGFGGFGGYGRYGRFGSGRYYGGWSRRGMLGRGFGGFGYPGVGGYGIGGFGYPGVGGYGGMGGFGYPGIYGGWGGFGYAPDLKRNPLKASQAALALLEA
jgi:hypothetical protein